jgi:hypothetical protein
VIRPSGYWSSQAGSNQSSSQGALERDALPESTLSNTCSIVAGASGSGQVTAGSPGQATPCRRRPKHRCTGPSSKSLATCCGTSCGSRTSRSSPQRSSHQSLPPQREGLWIRCGCAADGNCGPEVASCGTSARCNSPSPDLTDSAIRYVPPEAPGDRDAGRCPRPACSPMLPTLPPPRHRCGSALRQGRRRARPARVSLLLALLAAKKALNLGGELVA